jgi:dTDP-4-dehydrorhamnose 3,5-epimerase
VSRFNFMDLSLDGLKRVERQSITDLRGTLVRMFCSEELKSIGWDKPIAQINLTHTKSKGTIRGLHFQRPPYAEMKLVSCPIGKVWDVAVDLRANSKTFLQWHAEILSGINGYSLLIPEGFAHGFQALTDEVEMLYFHSERYEPSSEGGLNPSDPLLNISWPLGVTELSSRDQAHPYLNSQFTGIVL